MQGTLSGVADPGGWRLENSFVSVLVAIYPARKHTYLITPKLKERLKGRSTG